MKYKKESPAEIKARAAFRKDAGLTKKQVRQLKQFKNSFLEMNLSDPLTPIENYDE